MDEDAWLGSGPINKSDYDSTPAIISSHSKSVIVGA
jgi:hypothetical protein